MKKQLLISFGLVVAGIIHAKTPRLDYHFKDSAFREVVAKTFDIPVELKEDLDDLIGGETGEYLRSLIRKYSGQEMKLIYNYDKFEHIKNQLARDGFEIIDIRETLSVVHEDLPDYVITIELRDFDTCMNTGSTCNRFQGVSSIPGLITVNAVIANHSLDEYAAAPDEAYYYQYNNDATPELTDFYYLTVTKRIPTVQEELKKEILQILPQEHADAIKRLIMNGAIWTATEDDLGFTPDGKVVVVTTVQPSNSLAREFFSTSSAKVIWNVYSGMTSFNDLMDEYEHTDYKFSQEDLDAVFRQFKDAQRLESDTDPQG